MENLDAFHRRVDSFQHSSLPRDGHLTTKPLLAEKIAPDGTMRPFFGNTMIFALPEDIQLTMARMQLLLHHSCADMFAQPIIPSTLHMTLHDLLNGVDEAALREPVLRTGEQACAILARQRGQLQQSIHLTSTLAFNMTNGSICLGFAPDSEEDCAALMSMHACYQEVVALNYPLTPHVTLAYFRPGTYGPEAVARLDAVLRQINSLPPVALAVSAACLHYYTFSDMNSYLRH